MKKVRFRRLSGYNIDECIQTLNEKIEDGEIPQDIISLAYRIQPPEHREKRTDGSETNEELHVFFWQEE